MLSRVSSILKGAAVVAGFDGADDFDGVDDGICRRGGVWRGYSSCHGKSKVLEEWKRGLKPVFEAVPVCCTSDR